MKYPNKIPLILFSLLIVFNIPVQAQNPQILFQKNYGGSGNEILYSYTYTSDGHIVFWGVTQSNDGDISKRVGTTDMWALSINDNGAINWDKCYGSDSGSISAGISTTAGGFYLSGRIWNKGNIPGFHAKDDYYCAKTDHSGNIVWHKAFGGSEIDYLRNSISTSEGGVLLMGTTASNDGDVTGFEGYGIWLVKVDVNGNIIWENYIGNKNYATNVADGLEKSNGGYILVGLDAYPFDFKYTIMNLDAQGNMVYSKRYGGTDLDEARRIRQTKDGGYIIIGTTQSFDGDVKNNHGGKDIWVIKTKSNLDLEWAKTYGGSGDDKGYDIIECIEGGYIIAGSTGSTDGDVKGLHLHPFGNGLDAWVVKINDTGTIQWQTCLGGTGGDGATGIIQAPDNNYYVLGGTTSNDGDLTHNNGGIDFWFVKLSQYPTTVNKTTTKNTDVTVYPNPAGENIKFTIKGSDNQSSHLVIRNIEGKIIAESDFESEYIWNVSNIAPAVYYYEISYKENLVERGKVSVVR